MADAQDFGTATREQLLAIIAQQRAVITELQATVTALRAELAELKRRQQRQAAPFSTGQRLSQPKPPGRHPGEGTFEFRRAPAPEAVTGPPVEVPVTREVCPRCGGDLDAATFEAAWVTELPAAPQPQVTEYRVAVCRCRGCGRVVRGTHADVAADQYGACWQPPICCTTGWAYRSARCRRSWVSWPG